MQYKVKFPSVSIEKRFYRELEVVPEKIQKEIINKTLFLADDPRPHGEPKIKPPLEVYSYTAQYRIRIGNFRVLYDIDDRIKTVWVLALRRRGERTYRR